MEVTMFFILFFFAPILLWLGPWIFGLGLDYKNGLSFSHDPLWNKEEKILKAYRKNETEWLIKNGEPVFKHGQVRGWHFTAPGKEKWILFDNYEVPDDDKPHRVIYKNYETMDRIYRDLDRMKYDKEYKCKKELEDCDNKVYMQKKYEVRQIQTGEHKGEFIRYDTEFKAYYYLNDHDGYKIIYCTPEGRTNRINLSILSRYITFSEYIAYGGHVSLDFGFTDTFGRSYYSFETPDFLSVEKTVIQKDEWTKKEEYKVIGIDFQKYHLYIEKSLEELRQKRKEKELQDQKDLERLNNERIKIL